MDARDQNASNERDRSSDVTILWKPCINLKLRVATLVIKGLPWQAWSHENVSKAIQNWGEVIGVVLDFNSIDFLEDMKVFALVNNDSPIDNKVWCDLGDCSFLLSVVEVTKVDDSGDSFSPCNSHMNDLGRDSVLVVKETNPQLFPVEISSRRANNVSIPWKQEIANINVRRNCAVVNGVVLEKRE
ncbi:hypothetical protein REPUB_Repub03eG0238900 [Reevesia pubescens]